ncbi:hypothetical protein [Thiomicrorhabdus sp. 6S3-12]|uniref:hypothetical protein n=1 Tax=Thiomicrorhabdus sp. 6S3-12 TaxID=2819681 RepID=UPI001AAC4EF9|nr:hypothetical protein [Thiomicrorhabdus sp. 6S3-12]MBO1924572.1 hypothetical protein [Thiomicrorhabdus sp. 6S3-12]
MNTGNTLANEVKTLNTADEVRAVMIQGLSTFVHDYILVLKGEKQDFACRNAFAINNAMDLIQHLSRSASDLKKLEAENTQEVLKALKSGKISLHDAKWLMDILKTESDITDLKELVNALNAANPSIS